MYEFDGFTALSGNSFEVHEARGVGSRDVLGTGPDMAAELVLSHTGGDGRFFDGEHSAESAALVPAFRFDYLDAFHQFQEVDDLIEPGDIPLRRGGETQFAHSVAGVVDADLVRKYGGKAFDFQYVVQELDDVGGLFGGGTSGLLHYLGMEMAHVCSATCPRGHYIIVSGEKFVIFPGQRQCFCFEAGVSHRLSAASLLFGVSDLESEAFEELIGSYADLREESVDVAGDKQTYAHRYLVCR